jgi:hypothetical protein
MFILHPDKYLLPDYKISPFRHEDILRNHQLPPDDFIDTYFGRRFSGRAFSYTLNGRSALRKSLQHYALTTNDVVTILTTSGNFYVSSCVTSEVEKICRWNREINDETKIILVVHEFGYPYPALAQLKRYNMPIIEDAAYAFFSGDADDVIGRVGDFVIFSFPKMFPIQTGGLVVHNKNVAVAEEEWPHPQLPGYIKNVLSFYIKNPDDIIGARITNYLGLKERFERLGYHERFSLAKGVVPGVFMFKADAATDLKGLRGHFHDHGIQSSVFYTEHAFFIPVHQALSDFDLDYFAEVIKSF